LPGSVRSRGWTAESRFEADEIDTIIMMILPAAMNEDVIESQRKNGPERDHP
jgi:hypothetical protein